ncbi:O-succinylhomoserine sulfhydrylase [Magnetovibrio blakemorei]|uniref:O-succinylhomoserine sulfhydrylase n=1 Tax=Magnetovibrio blakemorei TaxID=28181 RepID=A0A1E5Q862_9PROT|nr:O-succinylhomoserine sulfhydrylase [Magnetovibrio blakemorei]OEJ67537.1 O-succinylhomoserine sulfhydrylase [Magnetovibrio blakemorei]
MTDTDQTKSWRSATRQVRAGLERTAFGETSEALFMTSGFVYDSAEQAERAFTGEEDHYVYSRYANPTLSIFENRLAAVEGAKYCKGTASGMAAVFAALAAHLKTGDRVVAAKALFGACYHVIHAILPRWGIQAEFVDGTDLDAWAKALSTPAQAVFLETPSNPALSIIDLAAVSALAHKAGALVIVDNAFASTVLQHPLELGADVVTYSATKHIDGQGRSLGGAILSNNEEYLENTVAPFLRQTGPALSPYNAWILLKGLETIELRVQRQCDNALQIAQFLSTQDAIEEVIYPGLESHPQHHLAMKQMSGKGGTIIAFNVKGGKEGAFKIMNGLQIIDISNNLGDVKSLITHPATTTHQKMTPAEQLDAGIRSGTIRLSVGIEDVRDLIDDLSQAST